MAADAAGVAFVASGVFVVALADLAAAGAVFFFAAVALDFFAVDFELLFSGFDGGAFGEGLLLAVLAAVVFVFFAAGFFELFEVFVFDVVDFFFVDFFFAGVSDFFFGAALSFAFAAATSFFSLAGPTPLSF